MEITSEYVATLRTFLTGEGDFIEMIKGLQDRDGDKRSDRVYSALAESVLTLAARRRFAGGYTDADVIRLVGRARALLAGDYEIDPLAAEATLRYVLGKTEAAKQLDGPKVAAVLFPLLMVLLDEQDIIPDRIDDFLAEAVPPAEAFLARHASR
jgi:hypothetical protein